MIRVRLTRLGLVLAATAAGLPVSSRADLVVLQDGTTHAGRGIEGSGAVRVETGTPAGPERLSWSSSHVRRIFRGEEEVQEIRNSTSGKELRSWAAGYFHAGMVDLAGQCVRRALQVDPTLDADPQQGGDSSYRTFWNRTVFAHRESRLQEAGADLLLETARWARQADFSTEALSYLRRAWQSDRDSVAVRRIAEDWDVYLGPWQRLDLTPSLVGGLLLTDTIQDEELTVTALPGMTFLLLPYRCSTLAGPQILQRSSLRDSKDLYGFVMVQFRTARTLTPLRISSEAVYERLELRLQTTSSGKDTEALTTRPVGPPSNRFQGFPSNSRGPRLAGPERTHREPSKDRFRDPMPVGGVGLIFEIPKSVDKYVVEWVDGTRDEVDLALLRKIPQPLPELGYRIEAPAESTFDPPLAVKSMADKLAGPSPAMAILAAKRLFRFPEEIGSNLPPKWFDTLDAALVRAGARPEAELREAVWSGFAESPRVSAAALAAVATESAQIQSEWIALLRSRVLRAGKDFNGEAAAAFLMAILQTDNESICGQALDVLMSLGESVDWGLAEKASQQAQSLALGRLREMTDPTSAHRLLRAILKDVRPATAGEIANQARRLGLRVTSPNDILFAQWLPNAAPAEQIGLLTVLEAVPLGDSLYSRAFERIAQETAAAAVDQTVRVAAMRMTVEQARYWREAAPGASDRAAFPLQASLETRDCLLRGLGEIASRGPLELRVQALAELILAGYAEQAARSLAEGCPTDALRLDVLQRLLAARPEVRSAYGFPALLGHLLRGQSIEMIDWAAKQLRDANADTWVKVRWQLMAALKAGVDFGELSQHCYPTEGLTASLILPLLRDMGHLTLQDRMRLHAAASASDFQRRLERVDLRRSSIVDGRYGVIAVLEVLISEAESAHPGSTGAPPTHYRWSVPRRFTIVLPSLRLESAREDDMCVAAWDGTEVGYGQIKTEERIRSPVGYAPRLENPEEAWLGRSGWGWPDLPTLSPTETIATGPAVLANRTAAKALAPGRLNLELAGMLSFALQEQKLTASEQIRQAIPTSCPVSVRYAAFAGYYGTGPRMAPPPRSQIIPGQYYLLNVMIVLERMGD